MSSRLMPPKVGSRIWQVRMISSGIFGVELDIEDVDIGKALEENRLAFHHRLAGQGADIAQAETAVPFDTTPTRFPLAVYL